ncbi:unnamed protein product [Closterium sp. NIES-65]|nr:unnamed protein product [Closterium sp. NIES-65]
MLVQRKGGSQKRMTVLRMGVALRTALALYVGSALRTLHVQQMGGPQQRATVLWTGGALRTAPALQMGSALRMMQVPRTGGAQQPVTVLWTGGALRTALALQMGSALQMMQVPRTGGAQQRVTVLWTGGARRTALALQMGRSLRMMQVPRTGGPQQRVTVPRSGGGLLNAQPPRHSVVGVLRRPVSVGGRFAAPVPGVHAAVLRPQCCWRSHASGVFAERCGGEYEGQLVDGGLAPAYRPQAPYRKDAELPASFFQLTRLHTLALSVSSFLVSPDLPNLISLNNLDIFSWSVTYEQILNLSSLPSITSLSISDNQGVRRQDPTSAKFDLSQLLLLKSLRKLPESLTSLTSLETLLVDDCAELVSVPRELESLKKLKCLELTGSLHQIEPPMFLPLSLEVLSLGNSYHISDLPSPCCRG